MTVVPESRPRIAIVGTWGVPAKYGGFETLAEQLARHVDPHEARLTIYGQRSAFTPTEREGDFAGHSRVWLPLSAKGPQSLLHDALQVMVAVFRDRHHILLMLGTSGAWILPILRLFRPDVRIVTNIDGLEWRREKFGPVARGLLKLLERWAVGASDAIIADNMALVPIVREIHGIDPAMIAYGGDQGTPACASRADPDGPFLTLQRIEPENNGAMILEGARLAGARLQFLGNWHGNAYARGLLKQYGAVPGIDLHPPVYDATGIAAIRAGSSAYVHGHSVGGTNPSLVEALFHTDRILAFDCSFNRATLEGQGAYFADAHALARLMAEPNSGRIAADRLEALRNRYRWRSIAIAYLDLLAPARRA